jgi:hypothetical protein
VVVGVGQRPAKWTKTGILAAAFVATPAVSTARSLCNGPDPTAFQSSDQRFSASALPRRAHPSAIALRESSHLLRQASITESLKGSRRLMLAGTWRRLDQVRPPNPACRL